MLTHYLIYGIVGFIIEIFWTGFSSLINGDWTLTGKTYLWMFFIYGMGISFEPIHDKIRRENILVRGFIWVFLIYTIEFISGFILDKTMGFCPWDYSLKTKYTRYGYIRLDYLPAWFLAGLLFERLHDFLDKNKGKLDF